MSGWPGRRVRWVGWVLCMLALAGLMASACAPLARGRRVTISGRITGQSIAAGGQGRSSVSGIAAAITCNGAKTRASHDGAFALTLPRAPEYHCVVAAHGYAPSVALIQDGRASQIVLNFDGPAAPAASCALDASQSDQVTCDALALLPGTLAGTVSGSDGRGISEGVTLRCEGAAAATQADAYPGYGQPNWVTTTTGAQGRFAFQNLPSGSYNCVAATATGVTTFGTIAVAPAASTVLNFRLCTEACPPVHYHFGPVMHDYTAYLIFWLPPGRVLDPSGDAAFIATIRQYFADVGGTRFFGLLSQYYDNQGPIANSARLGGLYVDTTPYEHCPNGAASTCSPAAATRADPLRDMDVEAEVQRAMVAEHWHAGLAEEFFVFLADGAQECEDVSASYCTFAHGGYALCGYHGAFTTTDNVPVIYSLISDANTEPDACVYSVEGRASVSPHGNWALDAEIASLSHEQFESITDPLQTGATGGWYGDGQQQSGTEIADLCQDSFPHIGPDGANVTLRDGARFLVQAEWSDAAGGCSLP